MKRMRARRANPASASRSAMAGDELAELVEIIEACIDIRGIYTLMDERVDLICGPGTLENIDSPAVTHCLKKFADAHGWSITRSQAGIVLWPRGAMTIN